VNAIHALMPALLVATGQAKALESGPKDVRFAPPYSSLQIGTIRGGQAINIIPEVAEAEIEARAIAGVDPRTLLAPVLEALGDNVLGEWMSTYPALALDADHPLAALVAEVSNHAPLDAVSFGTEAGLFQEAGIPSIICGPGDIARAHRPEEYMTRDELHGAIDMILALGRKLTA
jgi:acetylornithine deacetylase